MSETVEMSGDSVTVVVSNEQGPQGPVGDITPELEAARDDAQAAAAAALAAQTAAASSAAGASASAAVAAEDAGQSGIAASNAAVSASQAADFATAAAASATAAGSAETGVLASAGAALASAGIAEGHASAAAASAGAASASATAALASQAAAAASATASAGSAVQSAGSATEAGNFALAASGSATSATASAASAATNAGASAASASGSAGSAASAATSAAQAALIAAGLVYKGTVAGNAVANTSTAAGDFYVVTSAGTSQGKTWAAMDLAIYRGPSGTWDQVVYSTVTGSYVDPIAMTRAPLDGIAYSDGATANRRIEWTLGAAGNVAGSPLSEVGHVFRVPTSNPAVNASVFTYTATSTSLSATNSLYCAVRSAGTLRIGMFGATTGDERYFDHANFRAAYSGQLVRLDVVITPGVANPVVYINGVDASPSFVAATAGAPPDWMSTGLGATYRVCGLNWPAGSFRPGAPINRALTAIEIAQMGQTGALLASDRIGGSVSQLIANGDMSSVAGWTLGSGWSITGGQLVHTGSSSFGAATQATPLERGARYEYSFNLVSRSGASLLFQQGTNTTIITALLGLNTGSFIASETSQMGFKNAASGAMEAVIDDFSLRKVGALLQPGITRTAQVIDNGPNRIRGTMAAGVRSQSSSDPTSFEFTVTTSGAFVTGASTSPLFFETGMIMSLYAMADTAGSDLTFRRNSSATNDLVTALTDIPVANVWTPLSVIDAQRAFAAGETLWGSASAGTIRVRGTWTRN